MLLGIAWICSSNAQEVPNREPRLIGKKWADIDFGPSTTLSLQVSKDNIAYKGLAIRLDEGVGGVSSGTEFMVFDMDTLRWAGGWSGEGFIDWRGIALNGEHEIHPSIVGDLTFTNPVAPGWARPGDGSLIDERVVGRDGLRYGPLARDWAHWKGHYIHGDKVVLSYTVGDTAVLEMPGAEGPDGARVMSRTFNVGSRARDILVRIVTGLETDREKDGIVTFRQDGANGQGYVALVGEASPVEWVYDGLADALFLKFPKGDAPVRAKILIGLLPNAEAMSEKATQSPEPVDLEPLTHGGPTHWTEKIVTQGVRGGGDGAYAVDTVTHPVDNPYRSWMRFTGFDFFEDDSRAAIATWSGDIWLVEGIGDSMKKLTWQRIASGMFQPLGIAIVDGDIYAVCRDQITILRDLNGDGETDFYENFNNDHQVTEHFHEFALDLKVGLDGDLYYTKGGRHGADSITPQHGTLIRVSKDGETSELVANGFRAPNGLGLGPQGQMLVADNQGHWVPANRINWVEPGGFYGYMWGYHEGQTITGFDEPLCWIHPEVDRSPGSFVWVPDYRWGPLKGKIISVSYGMGRIYHVLHEEIDGVRQGGVVQFPLEFDTGVTRAAFRRSDGQLYLAGLFGWAGNKTQPGGFYRVRYTGKSLNMPEELHIASDGVVITFTDALDPKTATDPGNYGIEYWNYVWTKAYGSPDLKMDGSRGRDHLQASQVSLSADRRTVYIQIPGIRKVMQMEIKVNLLSAEGAEVRQSVHHTIHTLGTTSVEELAGQGVVKGRRAETASVESAQGLVQKFVGADGAQDLRVSRLAALYVAEGDAPTPFLESGAFSTTWNGSILSDLNETFRFDVEGNGKAELMINGNSVSSGNDVQLKQGANVFLLSYASPDSGDAELRLYWHAEELNREPVPATAFALPTAHGELDDASKRRHARTLVAENGCLACHASGQKYTAGSMPELSATAPALDGIAQRTDAAWLAKWIADPELMRPGTTMPQVFHGSDAKLTQQQVSDVVAYLIDGVGLEKQTRPKKISRKLAGRGAKLYADLGCFACHTLDTMLPDDDRTSLANLFAKRRHSGLAAYLQSPERFHANTRMPNFSLSEDESKELAAYLQREVGERVPSVEWLDGNSKNGRELLQSQGCVNCHALGDLEPMLVAPSLHALESSSLHSGCLSDTTGQRGGAPKFTFTSEERAGIRSFITHDL
ncbi:MAG: DUF6797 domain-containing protein, partial [Candidatus Hydrogenedentota bacterium]